MVRHLRAAGCLLAAGLIGACATFGAHETATRPSPQTRLALLRRAQVWVKTDVRAMDLRRGPSEKGSFAQDATVTCDYVDKKLGGRTPKFACAIGPNDEVKVKYGRDNGEVYGEVVATRLLWALGFGADRMYPVRVVCRGCPATITGPGVKAEANQLVLNPAVIERKAPGSLIETHRDEGWSWKELDLVDEAAGGAPIAHRDALKLLAALMQHTDTKPQQQRFVCLDTPAEGRHVRECGQPFMLLNDVGVTFGGADVLNRNRKGSVNFDRWSQARVWKNDEGCVASLPKSLSGTLNDPVISEPGRQFLADLLGRLSDTQIRDLFAAAHVTMRADPEPDKPSTRASVDDWAKAFKTKRGEIANRRCVAAH